MRDASGSRRPVSGDAGRVAGLSISGTEHLREERHLL
jgi:hypothetical protein